MKLKEMLVGLENLKVKGDLDIEISGVENNSKNVKQGYLFVAIQGFSTDGHQYVENAIENGAVAIMIQEGCNLKGVNIPDNITVVMAKCIGNIPYLLFVAVVFETFSLLPSYIKNRSI